MIYVADDGGRSGSTRARQRNDCVVRAIARTFGWRYDVAYDQLALLGRKCGRGTPKTVWQPYLNERSTKLSFPATAGQPRMTLERFAATHRRGRYVVQMAKHVVAVVDGVVLDDQHPDGARCVYAAWHVEFAQAPDPRLVR